LTSFDWLTHTDFGKGPLTLPKQCAGHRFLKWLIFVPLVALACMGGFAVLILPFLGSVTTNGEALLERVMENRVALLVVSSGVAAGLLRDIFMDFITFRMLQTGVRRVALPADRARLLHAVVVCEYKEPYEVLAETVRSLKEQTLAHNTIVVIAQEERDPNAEKTFLALQGLADGAFRDFICTRHTLSSGEVAGKSSNENHAVRELHRRIVKAGTDPFEVMVTIADADSHFDAVFLEQLEYEFFKLPDGRRTLFDSPMNTYRNLPECGLLIQHLEIARSQRCTFTHLDFQPCQSNYSLTLGFAQCIDFWDGDNTGEDLHTTLKAMAHNNAPLNQVVTVWSLILNDSVAGLGDRWTQAKRHMWGIEDVAWVLALFPILRHRVWMRLLGLTAGQMLTDNVVPPWLIFCFPQTIAFLSGLKPSTKTLVVWVLAVSIVYGWLKVFVREFLLRKFILAHRRPNMQRMSAFNWICLFVTYPVLCPLSSAIFNTAATWRMLFHALRNTGLKYVTAPKEFRAVNSEERALRH